MVLRVLNGGDTPFQTLELNRDSRRYFHLSVVNADEFIEEETGKVKEQISKHNFVSCSDKYLKTDYEKKYTAFNLWKDDFFYCLQDSAL